MKVIKFICIVCILALIGTFIPFGDIFETGVYLYALWNLIG